MMFGRSVSVVLVILVIPQSIFAEVLTSYNALFEITQEEDYVAWANRTSGVYWFVHPFGPFHSARFLASPTGDGMIVQMRTVTNGVDNARQAIDSMVREICGSLKPFYRELVFENAETNDAAVCIFKRGIDCRKNVLSVGAKKTGRGPAYLLFCELRPSFPSPSGLEDSMLTQETVMDVLRTECIGPFVFTNADPCDVLVGISRACEDKIMLRTGKDIEFTIALCKTNNLSFCCPATNCISALSLIADRLNLNLEVSDDILLLPKGERSQ